MTDSVSKELDIQFKKNNKPIEVDICFLEAPSPTGTNYIEIKQNTVDWLKLRKYKITGSRLPALLGLHGRKKFETMWDVVINGTAEADMQNIENIRRGHFYEEEDLRYFSEVSKATYSQCGFFKHPNNQRFGASPDALGPAGLLIEIKTRAKGSTSPLESIAALPGYFSQCQLQMACTDANFCILLSYHPESKSGNFFIIKRDNVLLDMLIELLILRIENKKVLDWEHQEIPELKLIGEKLFGQKY